MNHYEVTFMPERIKVTVPEGATIFEAAAQAGIALKSTCGGQGTCGRCAVRVLAGETSDHARKLPRKLREKGYVLACQTRVVSDAIIDVPQDSRLDEHQVLVQDKTRQVQVQEQADLLSGYPLAPLAQTFTVQLEPPSLTENMSDWSRLQAALRPRLPGWQLEIDIKTLQKLAATLRDANWQVDATVAFLPGRAEVIQVAPAGKSNAYALGIDIGTTTVVVSLLDLKENRIIDQSGTYNRQARFGDDVISRIIYATSKEKGLGELQEAVQQTINELINRLLGRQNISPEEVLLVAAAGNTTMAHLFLGLDPKYIRLQPYIPTASNFPPLRAHDLGLKINPSAWVFIFPGVASYVGGDIVSGALYSRLSVSDKLTLFIDIGTNGEMVLGNSDWLICCSCSAGPAFEGGGITFGMRAMKGAIQGVEIDPETFEVQLDVIPGRKPIGICGSGLIDCLAKLKRVGLIDRTGTFQDVETPRLRPNDEGMEFVLAWGEETECGKDIVITQADIKNLIRSKGAVFAGIQSLLKTVQLDLEAIDQILIAGGFGNYLNITNAIEIGLLPDLPAEKYVFMGNTSLKGTQLALLSRKAWEDAQELGRKMTYLELSTGNLFMEEFVSALFLPHTNLELFPSVVATEERLRERRAG